jgi:hypothetical protein
MASMTCWDGGDVTVEVDIPKEPDEMHTLHVTFGKDDVTVVFPDGRSLRDFVALMVKEQPAERLPF